MKKLIIATCLLLALSPANPAQAEDIFRPQLEEAATQVIEAWLANDSQRLSAGVTRLARYEYYHAAFANECEGSYLCHVPQAALNQGENTLAAHIFLIHKEKDGVSLWPKSLFVQKQTKMKRRSK